jgi:hypothetical protein
MRRLRRRNSDKHRTGAARVLGGPNDGLLVPVKERGGGFVYSDVVNFSQYSFDPEAWEFRYTPRRP